MNKHAALKPIGVLLFGLVATVSLGGKTFAGNTLVGSKVLSPYLAQRFNQYNALVLGSAKEAISSTHVRSQIAKALAKQLGSDEEFVEASVNVPSDHRIAIEHTRFDSIINAYETKPHAWLKITAPETGSANELAPASHVRFGRQLRESHYPRGEEPNWIGLQHQIFGQGAEQSRPVMTIVEYYYSDLLDAAGSHTVSGLAFLADYFAQGLAAGELLPDGVAVLETAFDGQLRLVETLNNYSTVHLRFTPSNEGGDAPRLHEVSFSLFGQQLNADADLAEAADSTTDGS